MRRVSMATRDELLAALAGRYRNAARAEKGVILKEFAEVTGYHRKHAGRLCAVPSRATGHKAVRAAGSTTMRCAKR